MLGFDFCLLLRTSTVGDSSDDNFLILYRISGSRCMHATLLWPCATYRNLINFFVTNCRLIDFADSHLNVSRNMKRWRMFNQGGMIKRICFRVSIWWCGSWVEREILFPSLSSISIIPPISLRDASYTLSGLPLSWSLS